jgi:hypothetical protein
MAICESEMERLIECGIRDPLGNEVGLVAQWLAMKEIQKPATESQHKPAEAKV